MNIKIKSEKKIDMVVELVIFAIVFIAFGWKLFLAMFLMTIAHNSDKH